MKIPKFQIPKQKTFKVYKKKSKYLNSPFVKLHTKKIKDPQNEKKKIEDSWIIFSLDHGPIYVKKIKDPQNEKKKIEDSWIIFSLDHGPIYVRKKILQVVPSSEMFLHNPWSLKWMFFTSSGVILITFFSLLMEGHFKWLSFFTPNGD